MPKQRASIAFDVMQNPDLVRLAIREVARARLALSSGFGERTVDPHLRNAAGALSELWKRGEQLRLV